MKQGSKKQRGGDQKKKEIPHAFLPSSVYYIFFFPYAKLLSRNALYLADFHKPIKKKEQDARDDLGGVVHVLNGSQSDERERISCFL